MHELAHLLTFEQFGNKVLSHGIEWKQIYAGVLAQFLQQKIFPPDIETELLQSLRNPAASTCAEDGLQRVLRKYDRANNSFRLVEELPARALFRTRDGRIFQKGEKLRKRFKVFEVKRGKLYLFIPLYEVEAL